MTLTKDLVSGIIFSAIGVAAAWIGSGYALGSLTRMGPGYFPVLLGGVIALVGLVLVIKALIDPASSEPVGRLGLRPLAFIVSAIIVFGLLIDRRGLIAGVAGLTIMSWMASRERRLVELLALVVVLNLVAVGIFVYGLGMPLRLRFW